eukprot:GHVS01081486.1.p1 GENE.GHVS01081486.1~~GHVS01081486.1.p1  ORF type:complete len:550 (-),score=95.56 GHVS01081486.1:462-2060(-)
MICTSSIILCTAQLRVLEPQTLFDQYRLSSAFTDNNDNTLIGSTATFGTPRYGDQLLGRAFYVKSATNHCSNDYCDDLKKLLEDFGGKSGKHAERLRHDGSLQEFLRTIVVVDRGGCSFVQKAGIAEKECTADAVIVVDKADTSFTREQVQHIIMADDGHGKTVDVPSMLLASEDGEKLKQAIMVSDHDYPVVLELEWTLPVQFPVEVNLFTDASNSSANQFLHDYSKYALQLQGNVYYTTSYFLFGLNGQTQDNERYCMRQQDIDPMLTNVGENIQRTDFCGLQPVFTQHEVSNKIYGGDIVMESLRQLCLERVTTVKGVPVQNAEYSEKYWLYQQRFWSDTPGVGCQFRLLTQGLEECSRYVVSELLTYDEHNKWEACMTGKEGLELLRESKRNKAWSIFGVQINGARISGRMEPEVVVSAICTGSRHPVTAQFRAPVCESIFAEVEAIETLFLPNIRWSSIVIVVTFMLVIFGLCLYMYKKRVQDRYASSIRDEVMLEVRAQLRDYYNLEDKEETEDGEYSRSVNRPLV